MIILSSEIDSNSIKLVVDQPVTNLVLCYDTLLTTKYEVSNLSTSIEITKEDLNLSSLNNIYFKIHLTDSMQETDSIGLHSIDIVNRIDSELYSVNKLKQDLDNLNYYDGILQSLTEKKDYLTANDTFYNYINFLENKINANRFLESIGRSNPIGTVDKQC